jgi:nitroimidazol reductase NimA-like FMN-containing flavoprotein (pyridoxamine 5'-phosphate oxidase superfamily)
MDLKRSAAPSARTRVRRLPARAHYDAQAVHAIVDEALSCTIAFEWEGSVHAIPTAHWREGTHLYVHGAKASRTMKALPEVQACVSISLIDGLVLARSAFNHSMNYRAVVTYGRFERVDDPAAKLRSLEAFMDRIAPGRWAQLRPVTRKELDATTVLRLALDEASAKIRAWGPKDDAEDLGWPVWAGVLPLEIARLAPRTEADSAVQEAPQAP